MAPVSGQQKLETPADIHCVSLDTTLIPADLSLQGKLRKIVFKLGTLPSPHIGVLNLRKKEEMDIGKSTTRNGVYHGSVSL